MRTGLGQIRELNPGIRDHVRVFDDKAAAFAWKPSHIIISNPTSFHMDFVVKAIEMQIPFFVEKPLCSQFEEINRLPAGEKYFGVVGYNLRFHGLFGKIKEMIQSGTSGKALSASFFVGHYLPFWHPELDYSQRYEARKDLGGRRIKNTLP